MALVGFAEPDQVRLRGAVTGATSLSGMNVAARLETLANPGGICIRRNVRNQVRGKLDLDFEDLGEVEVRNIDRKVRAFRVVMNEKASALAVAPLRARTMARPRWQTSAAAVLALVLIAGLAWWRPWSPAFEPVDPAEMTQVLPEKPSIAVLALNDNSAADDAGYLSDAISEGIITELSRFSEFFVIARYSSFKYRDEPTDVRTIAQELGVHYVLEGSQQKQGDRLRVTVQLIDALAGTHIWSESYDSKLADLFAVQDEIVRAVASAVGGRIAFHPPPAGGLAAVSAMEHHLQGREYMRRFTPEDTQIALDLNRNAIAADPTSPFGYIGSAFAYLRAHTYGWTDVPQDQALDLAREAADKALKLSPDN